MNQLNPRPGKYVEPIPVDAKKQDQNTAVVGPTRVPVDEQVKQVLDTKPSVTNQIVGIGASVEGSYGDYYPNLWYTQQNIRFAAYGVTNTVNTEDLDTLQFRVNALYLPSERRLVEMFMWLDEGNIGYSGQPAAQIQIALYSSYRGLPYAKLGESPVYDVPSLPNYPGRSAPALHLFINQTLPAGRYFIAVANGGGTLSGGYLGMPKFYSRDPIEMTDNRAGVIPVVTDLPPNGVGAAYNVSPYSMGINNDTLIVPDPTDQFKAGTLADIIDFSDYNTRIQVHSIRAGIPDVYLKFA